jgi:hypothetical protein
MCGRSDKITVAHSITSSAVARSVGGMISAVALVALEVSML